MSSAIPYVENLVQMVRVLQHREAENQLTIDELSKQLKESEKKIETGYNTGTRAIEMSSELRVQNTVLEQNLFQTKVALKRTEEELDVKAKELKKAEAQLDILTTKLIEVTKELKFVKNDHQDKRALLKCNKTSHENCKAAGDKLQNDLRSKSERIKELSLQLHFLRGGIESESNHIERELNAKLSIANKQIFNLKRELVEERGKRTHVETSLKAACRRLNGLEFPHTETLHVQLNKYTKLDHSCCNRKFNKATKSFDDGEFLKILNEKALQKVELLEWALVEQGNVAIKQRRLFEDKIGVLEKALYAKTREAEDVTNSAENVEWRNTVRRVLGDRAIENKRLADALKTAMALIQRLEKNREQARMKEANLKDIVDQMQGEFDNLPEVRLCERP